MTFLHPSLLAAGLACVAIPIIIHLLLRQRRRPIVWGAMRFLLEAYRKQRRKLRLQHFLLLLTRCLILASLAVAIGRPLLEEAGLLSSGGGRTLYLMIDNGLASNLRGPVGEQASLGEEDDRAIDRHKRAAIELLDGLGPGDRAALIALGAPARQIVIPPSTDLDAVRELVEEMQPTDATTDVHGGFSAAASAIGSDEVISGESVLVALLSDFLTGSADLSRPLPRTMSDDAEVRLLASPPAARSPGNVQVVSIDPLRPVVLTGASGSTTQERVRLHLRRSGPIAGEAATTSLKLRMSTEDEQSASPVLSQVTVRWSPGQTEATTTAHFDATFNLDDAARSSATLIAEIDRDALERDNTVYRPIQVREALRIGIVAQRRFGAGPRVDRLSAADWFRLALKPTDRSPVELMDIEPASLDQTLLAGLDAVVLPSPHLLTDEAWPLLRRFADSGGLVIVSPPEQTTVHLWTDPFTEAFNLGWQLAREPASLSEASGVLDEQQPGAALLELIGAEIDSLIKPVRVFRWLPIEGDVDESQVLLRMKGGAPWIVIGEPQTGERSNGAIDPVPARSASRGLVVYFTSAPTLAWTDLPAKPLMVPLMQELTRQGVGRAYGSEAMIAGRMISTAPGVVELRMRTGLVNVERISIDGEGWTSEPLRLAGLWDAVDADGRPRATIGVNPDPAGGRVDLQPESAIEAWLAGGASSANDGAAGDRREIAWLNAEDPASAVRDASERSPISLPFMIAALALAILETGLARWFSHAVKDRGGRSGGQAASA